MYQIRLADPSPNTWTYTSAHVDVKDKMKTAITQQVSGYITNPFFLLEYKSEFTKKIKRYNPTLAFGTTAGVDITNRYISFFSKVSLTEDDDFANGMMKVGTTDFPYGFYDFKIYEMSSAGDYNPDNALAILYTGTMNLSQLGDYKEPVKYTEYTTNDSETESIYLTNPL